MRDECCSARAEDSDPPMSAFGQKFWRLSLIASVVFVSFLLTSCSQETPSEKAGTTQSELSETTETTTEKIASNSSTAQVPGLYFPRQKAGGGFADALSGGLLSVDEKGCLRKETQDGVSFTIIWSAEMRPESRGGKIVVLNEKDKVVAREGEQVRMGGGEPSSLTGIEAVDDRTAQELQDRCPGGYWLAAPEVWIPKEKTTD